MNYANSRRGSMVGVGVLLLGALISYTATAQTGQHVLDRLETEIAEGRPVVAHVVVALCDNVNQGIWPVSGSLGNGQDPDSNLYWGALYGVRTHLLRTSGWARVGTIPPTDGRILERVVLYAELQRGQRSVPVYVVADAWDGAHIRAALGSFIQMSAGKAPELIELTHGAGVGGLHAGGSSDLVAYVGHNGLMEFSIDPPVATSETRSARSALVLSCSSKSYFLPHLEAAEARPLLLTTGLMAPEAYTLDAAIRAWIANGSSEAVVEAAAQAYNRYQKCGLRGARRLFWSAP